MQVMQVNAHAFQELDSDFLAIPKILAMMVLPHVLEPDAAPFFAHKLAMVSNLLLPENQSLPPPRPLPPSFL